MADFRSKSAIRVHVTGVMRIKKARSKILTAWTNPGSMSLISLRFGRRIGATRMIGELNDGAPPQSGVDDHESEQAGKC